MRVYDYIGPAHLLEDVAGQPAGQIISSPGDVALWAGRTGQASSRPAHVIVTFIVSKDLELRIADRRSEHVACSSGEPVLGAGEMTFHVDKDVVSVVDISNQSTGFCPEPSCWPQVARALDLVGLEHPTTWTRAYAFRLCTQCGQRNLIKDEWFECGVCEATLPKKWNFA